MDGGTFTAGAWQTRILNTVAVDDTGAVILAANRFTLPAGTYIITASAPGNDVSSHQARLYNITDGGVQQTALGSDLYGTTARTGDAAVNNTMTDSIIYGKFVIAAAKVFEIQHRCQTTKALTGFGVASSFATDIYTSVQLLKVA